MLMTIFREAGEIPLAELDLPVEELEFDHDSDIPAFSAAPGVSAGTAPVTDSLPACGTHPICIRLPVWVIRAFKAEAAKCGGNYQTLMIRELAAVARKLK
ncbi:MAG: hypothetical protein WAW73_06340 [Rhodoferax sp.]